MNTNFESAWQGNRWDTSPLDAGAAVAAVSSSSVSLRVHSWFPRSKLPLMSVSRGGNDARRSGGLI
jgi:hypothetical protein